MVDTMNLSCGTIWTNIPHTEKKGQNIMGIQFEWMHFGNSISQVWTNDIEHFRKLTVDIQWAQTLNPNVFGGKLSSATFSPKVDHIRPDIVDSRQVFFVNSIK